MYVSASACRGMHIRAEDSSVKSVLSFYSTRVLD